jgi:hypothetical protein
MPKISRTKIELFLDCPHCFYLDQKRGIKRPSFPAFTLNSAVDYLLKKEFDVHRVAHTTHPLLTKYGLTLTPFPHPDLEKWRHNFTGVQCQHAPSGFLVFGAVDDIWQDEAGTLYVVDYKATSKDTTPDLEGKWQQAYKRQMEVYQWLLRHNNFKVSDTGYFVYVNGRRDLAAFDGKLEFDIHLIPYTGHDAWVEPTLLKIKDCLASAAIPKSNPACEYCAYRYAQAGDPTPPPKNALF